MTTPEFISLMQQNGAIVGAPTDDRSITLASSALQGMRAAMLPNFMIELYRAASGLNLGDAYIFSPAEIVVAPKITIPSIVDINNDLSYIGALRGRTVFGRNDLFWFTFEATGRCAMHDATTMVIARVYDDPIRALADCLIIGKM